MKKIHKERQIYALLDGRLKEGQREKLESHLEACPDCREFLEQARAIKSELKRLGSRQPENVNWKATWNVIEANIDKEMPGRRVPVRQGDFSSLFWKLSLGTAVALLLFAFYVVYEKYRSGEDEEVKTAQRDDGKEETQDTVSLAPHTEPAAGYVTFTSKNVSWSVPGVGLKQLDIETVLREGAQINAQSSSSAGIQIGSSIGIRVEPLSSVTFTRMTQKEIALQLHRGSVSVDFTPSEKKVGLSIHTDEARVTVKGTLFSVSRKNDQTSVVVGRGLVLVTPKRDQAGAVHVKRSEGVRVGSKGKVSSLEQAGVTPETQRLENVLFNVFEEQIPEETLSINVEGNGDFAFIDVDGKKENSTHITMRKPSGEGEAKLILKNGNEVPLTYSINEGKSASVKFNLSTYSELKLPGIFSKKPKKTSAAPEEKLIADKSNETTEDEEEETGFIDPFIIKMKILKHKGAMRACYEKYLDSNPEEKSVKARIAFTIGTSGKVTTAGCSSNVPNKEIKSCLTEVIKSIAFPPPEGGPVKFEYPVTFTPK